MLVAAEFALSSPQPQSSANDRLDLQCVCEKKSFLRESIFSSKVDLDVGQLQHYRSYCVDHVTDCEGSYLQHIVKDTSLWTWKGEVIRNSSNVLRKLGFL